MYKTIINTQKLEENLANPEWKILDCRFNLGDPKEAESNYIVAHIPGAAYAHLDRDLSAPIRPGVTGRHPLPKISDFEKFLGSCGIEQGMQVVVYDATGGALAASRAWWLLRWLGCDSVAVLDGGWQKWVAEGRSVRGGIEDHEKCVFKAIPHPEMMVTSQQVETRLQTLDFKLLDSRSEDRFRGENETMDPVAGHIPGAISVPFGKNLRPDGTFCTPEELRERFSTILGNAPVEETVFYCGSGVTANHNILAVEIAGLGTAKLYPGSWSEWITDPNRPVTK